MKIITKVDFGRTKHSTDCQLRWASLPKANFALLLLMEPIEDTENLGCTKRIRNRLVRIICIINGKLSEL